MSGYSFTWFGRSIDYRVDQEVVDLFPEALDAVRDSYGAWNDVACSDLSFNFVGVGTDLRAGFNPAARTRTSSSTSFVTTGPSETVSSR
ncbi:MAG: hypothetical protein HC923_11385 [Myxococcales bacterium]|nr:hypothetical protein [Myxococcales bacterium]